MGKIHRNFAILAPSGLNTGTVPNYNIQKEDTLLEAYWGEIDMKYFKISFKNLEKLFAQAKSKKHEVAFCVQKIGDPEKVKGKWIVFDGKAKANEDYYIFSEKFYEDHGNTIVPGQRMRSFNKMPYNFICALIGKATEDNAISYPIFFHPARTKYLIEFERGSGGPDGAGGGVEIPPH